VQETLLCSRQPLTDRHYRHFLVQILIGLAALHAAGVVHRNLKPTNIGLNENCSLVLCDPGVGVEEDFVTDKAKANVTRWYRSPEALLRRDVALTAATDIWSAAAVILQFYHNRKPVFPGKSAAQVLAAIYHAIPPRQTQLEQVADAQWREHLSRHIGPPAIDIWAGCSDAILPVLKSMLVLDPGQRPTAHELAGLPVLSGTVLPIDAESLESRGRLVVDADGCTADDIRRLCSF
jgi:serine/threonine protein kinase